MISKLIKHLHLQFPIPAFNQYNEPVKHSQKKALKLILTLLTGFLLNTLFLCIYIGYNKLMIINENILPYKAWILRIQYQLPATQPKTSSYN